MFFLRALYARFFVFFWFRILCGLSRFYTLFLLGESLLPFFVVAYVVMHFASIRSMTVGRVHRCLSPAARNRGLLFFRSFFPVSIQFSIHRRAVFSDAPIFPANVIHSPVLNFMRRNVAIFAHKIVLIP